MDCSHEFCARGRNEVCSQETFLLTAPCSAAYCIKNIGQQHWCCIIIIQNNYRTTALVLYNYNTEYRTTALVLYTYNTEYRTTALVLQAPWVFLRVFVAFGAEACATCESQQPAVMVRCCFADACGVRCSQQASFHDPAQAHMRDFTWCKQHRPPGREAELVPRHQFEKHRKGSLKRHRTALLVKSAPQRFRAAVHAIPA